MYAQHYRCTKTGSKQNESIVCTERVKSVDGSAALSRSSQLSTRELSIAFPGNRGTPGRRDSLDFKKLFKRIRLKIKVGGISYEVTPTNIQARLVATYLKNVDVTCQGICATTKSDVIHETYGQFRNCGVSKER